MTTPTSSIPVSEKLGDLQTEVTSLLQNPSKKIIRYGAVSLSEVFDRVVPSGCTHGKYENWQFLNGIRCKVTPVRLRAFKDNRKCIKCGCEGNVFLIERGINDVDNQRAYLNLYAMHKGALKLMTVDHILPDSFGGKYSADNFQTMCYSCNKGKGNIMTLSEIRRVRDNTKQYAKDWVNHELLAAILHVQSMYHISTGSLRKQYLELHNKYPSLFNHWVSKEQIEIALDDIHYELRMLEPRKISKRISMLDVFNNWLHNISSLNTNNYKGEIDEINTNTESCHYQTQSRCG